MEENTDATTTNNNVVYDTTDDDDDDDDESASTTKREGNGATEIIDFRSAAKNESDEGGYNNNDDVAVVGDEWKDTYDNAVNDIEECNDKDNNDHGYNENENENDDDDEHRQRSSSKGRVSFCFDQREVVEVPGFDESAFFDEREEEEAEERETKRRNAKFPTDCYSFLSLHGPCSNPQFFLFGLIVFLFQITFECLMMMRVISKYSTNEDTDNPWRDSPFNFIPSNVSGLVRTTQFVALLSYCAFADDTLKDIVKAVEMFPRFEKATPGDNVHRMVVSCVLRLIQGVLATIVVLVLIVQTPDVIDIILNFTAVNFISSLDDIAFELAQWGKYGAAMKAEADRIENLTVPDCVYRKYDHIRYRYTISVVATLLIALLSTVAMTQGSTRFFTTRRLRVQFKDGSLFEDFSGCYDLDPETTSWSIPRKGYDGFDENNQASFGYCDVTKKWHLYEKHGDGDGDGNGDDDDGLDAACNTTNAIAWSAKTYTFDIFSTFEDTWYSTSGRPLELYFFDNETSLTDLQCNSALGDGICNEFFNKAEYDYDEGDCCSVTCDETRCGIGSLTEVFGTKIATGNGYPLCSDMNMKDITIRINDVFTAGGGSRSTPTGGGVGGPGAGGDLQPREPLMIVDCDGKNVIMASINRNMTNKTESIKVADGANCMMMVKNSTVGNAGVLYVGYTVFHGDEASIVENPIVMVHGDSTKEQVSYFQRIPDCYFDKLNDHIDIATIYTASNSSNKAVKWLMKDSRMFSNCGRDEFLERYALATINFAAPIVASQSDDDEALTTTTTDNDQGLWITPSRHCVWRVVGCTGNIVTELNYKALGDNVYVSGTLATEIGLLKNLTQIALGRNSLYGTIPSQIGQISDLSYFDVQMNVFTGSVPTEIGELTKLTSLVSHTNRLSGSIPGELGNLSSLRNIWMWSNFLTGSIPSEIGKLTLLNSFVMDFNELTGPIPSTFGNLFDLEYLSFSMNFLTGTIPTELSETRLDGFVADFNSLTGSVPSEVLELNFTQLDVFGNKLSNLIPVDGSVVCPNPADAYPFNIGDHYCNCASNCLTDKHGNKCACADGRSCCDSFLEKYTECVICEYGFENPNFFIPDELLTCEIFEIDRRKRITEFGTAESCDAERTLADEQGCRCNTEAPEGVSCSLCPSLGLSNPGFYVEPINATCTGVQNFIKSNQQIYSDPAECRNVQIYFYAEGCRCSEGPPSEEQASAAPPPGTAEAVENAPGTTGCVGCEFGLENPDFPLDEDTTCQDFDTFIEQEKTLYGQEEQCNDARASMEEAGCICRDAAGSTAAATTATEDFGFECIVCESGLQNPDFYLEESQARCIDSAEFVRTNIEENGTKSSCEDVRIGLLALGCICNNNNNNEGPVSDADSEVLSSPIQT